MRPPETLKHGTALIACNGGWRIRWADGTTAGRVRARLRRDRTAWIAFCDAWDGYTWTRDKVITRPTLPELEDAVRQYADAVDQHAWVATGACHS